MASNLVVPRPIRLGTGTSVHLPFFLSNALSGASSVEPSSGITKASNASPQPQTHASINNSHITPQIPINHPVCDEMSIEDMAANIRLDDEPLSHPLPLPLPLRSGPGPDPLSGAVDGSDRPLSADKPVIVSTSRWMPEDGSVAPPRSPEAAALDEFLNILRPVIRAPSSPIARSKRLVPRSRHHGLAVASSSASCDRHHPYARSAKSSSPQGVDTLEGVAVSLISGGGGERGERGSKKGNNNGRSSAAPYSRRRSSNANDSSHSCGSTSISSSRSQSISRRGSDGSLNYFNAWRANSPASTMAMDINTSMDEYSHPESGVASLLLLSGVSPHNSSPDPQ